MTEFTKMTAGDIEGILVVENLSFTIPWSREAFIEELENPNTRYVVAKQNNTAIAYGGMWKVLDEGHITNIAVHPEFRKSGIGSRILEHLIGMARREGLVAMTLEVRRSNIAALKLYEKYGFMEEGIRKGYYSDTKEDAVIMWKRNVGDS